MFTGDHLHHRELEYWPRLRHAVSPLGRQFVCIAEHCSPPVLHIHSISSSGGEEEVRRIELEDLMEDEGWLSGVSVSEDGKSVTVVVGDSYIRSVLLYQVRKT